LKIWLLSPQFVTESPTVIDEVTSSLETAAPHLKVVPAEGAGAADNSGGHLDRETRDGLKRLSRLIQDKKLKAARALENYRRVALGESLTNYRGTNLSILG